MNKNKFFRTWVVIVTVVISYVIVISSLFIRDQMTGNPGLVTGSLKPAYELASKFGLVPPLKPTAGESGPGTVPEAVDPQANDAPEPAVPEVQSEETDPPGVDYMGAYQDTLEYTVPAEFQVPAGLLAGFDPVISLVNTSLVLPSGYEVKVPQAPADVQSYLCFPQDYSEGDSFNPGCQTAQELGQLPWSVPIAGYNDGENFSCDSPDGWCSDDIQAQNWRVITGYELCHPAVGCVKDPDGGAAMILFINLHDSDEVWGPRNNSAIYVDSGFIGYGPMWDLSGGSYDLGKGIADIRNHFFYQLSTPVSPNDNHLRGQCGDSHLCETITYVVVARVWDRSEIGINFSHFELLDYGQWHRP